MAGFFGKTLAGRFFLTLGKRGKTPPCCESGSWVALRFLRCGKILNVSQRIHLRFFHIAKIEYQPNLRFLATGRFCLASLEKLGTSIFSPQAEYITGANADARQRQSPPRTEEDSQEAAESSSAFVIDGRCERSVAFLRATAPHCGQIIRPSTRMVDTIHGSSVIRVPR